MLRNWKPLLLPNSSEQICVIGSSIALDTTAAIRLLNAEGASSMTPWLWERVYLPAIVIGELRFGALHSSRVHENLDRITSLASSCTVLIIDETTSRSYAEIRLRLKAKGRPIPENDIWIAAVCLQHELPLACHDEHFGHVDGLQLHPI